MLTRIVVLVMVKWELGERRRMRWEQNVHLAGACLSVPAKGVNESISDWRAVS
jgi:hypothetical protein